MIALTKLNGDRVVVNADQIRFVEGRPDTYVTFVDKERLIVRESVEQVVGECLAYARALRIERPAA